MIYVLHGDDSLGIWETLRGLRQRLGEGDEVMAAANTTVLDGQTVTLADLEQHATTLPFMGERRLVIVHGLLARVQTERAHKQWPALKALLSRVPESTRLVMIEGIDLLTTGRKTGSQALKWLEEWRLEQPAPREALWIRRFEVPSPQALPGWVKRRVERLGGHIEPRAAALLAAYVGGDTWSLATHIDKLVTWADSRAISESDVRELVPQAAADRMFELVDALANRDAPAALSLLRTQLGGDPASPLRLLAALAYQVRNLIGIKALEASGRGASAAARLKIPPFVVDKLRRQAGRFSLQDLLALQARLLDVDVAIKTGRSEAPVALDLLVADLCLVGRRGS
jgi:DNA polymerase-3 subunit delta